MTRPVTPLEAHNLLILRSEDGRSLWSLLERVAARPELEPKFNEFLKSLAYFTRIGKVQVASKVIMTLQALIEEDFKVYNGK